MSYMACFETGKDKHFAAPALSSICCRDEYVAMGLYHIARAVSFLNNDCSLVQRYITSCLSINLLALVHLGLR